MNKDLSIDLVVGEAYSIKEMLELDLLHFYTARSLWTDGLDVYLFKHTDSKDKRYVLERIVYKKLDATDCCGPARLGI